MIQLQELMRVTGTFEFEASNSSLKKPLKELKIVESWDFLFCARYDDASI
jgi:hypothetical protein